MLDDSGRPFLAKWRRPAHLAASVCLAVTITATLAWAAFHTRLESSVPAADEVLTVAPERFELRFSGPVNEGLSALVLVAPAGDSLNVALRTPGDDRILVGEVPELADGQHRVLWRTVSADGHPVSGEFEFTFAEASAGDGHETEPETSDVTPESAGAVMAELAEVTPDPKAAVAAGSGESGPPAGMVFLAGLGMACLLGFAGLLWYCGSLPLMHEPRIGRAATVLGWAALLILAGHYLAWMLSVLPSGAGFEGITAAVASSTGFAGVARLVLIAIALVALPRHGRAAAVLALTAVVVGAMSGHTAAISPWITMPAKVVHLGAASVWLGGLLLLALAPDGPTDGSDAWHFGAVVRAVSAAALLSVLLIAASGIIQSTRFVGDLSAYWGTPYGRGVLAKWAGLLVLIGFGAFHRFLIIPTLDQDRKVQRLRRTVRLEMIVMLAVVMVAAWLARVSQPGGH